MQLSANLLPSPRALMRLAAVVGGLNIGGIVAVLLLAACAAVPPQPADPAVAHRIAQACLASGLFKTGIGLGLSLAPVAGPVAAQLVSAGVDQVCADPARFAGDISTVEWVLKNTGQKPVALL